LVFDVRDHLVGAVGAIDFSRDFPAFVVAKWLGHSPTVALRHYATAVPDDIHHRATGKGATQNPTQSAPEVARQERTDPNEGALVAVPKADDGGELQPVSVDDGTEESGAGGNRTPVPSQSACRLYACVWWFDLDAPRVHQHTRAASSQRCCLAG